MKYLVVQLYGPMVAWGDLSVGEERTARMVPSRSGTIGLVASALGIPREDANREASLATGIGVAAVVLGDAQLMVDFHTIEVPGEASVRTFSKRRKRVPLTREEEISALGASDDPILSYRSYFQDTLALAGIWLREGSSWSIEKLAAAFERPGFAPFLGRRSCPTALPFSPRIVDADHPVHALDREVEARRAQLEALKLSQPLRSRRAFFWEGSDEQNRAAGIKPATSVRRRDDPRSRRTWQFVERVEFQLTKDPIGEADA